MHEQGTPLVFNSATALARLGGDTRLFKDLICFFQEDAPELMAKIREAVETSDAKRLAQAAHRLKGLCANFDATVASDAAHRLETIGLSGDCSAANGEVPRLETAVENLDRALADFARQH